MDASSVCPETFFRKKLVFTFHPFRVWYANMNDISSWFLLPAYFNGYEISMSESLLSEVIFLGIISVDINCFICTIIGLWWKFFSCDVFCFHSDFVFVFSNKLFVESLVIFSAFFYADSYYILS